jgi:O-antigen/teichoic acid export membrane protein
MDLLNHRLIILLSKLGPDRLVSLLDQTVTAAFRFATILVFARLLSKDDFGVVAIAISTSFLFVGLGRGAFGLPFATFCANEKTLEKDGVNWFGIIVLMVLGSSFVPLAFAAIARVTSLPAWTVDAALYSAIISPAAVCYESSRRWIFQWKRYRSILSQVAVYGCASAAGLVVFAIWPTPALAICSTASAYLIGLLIGLRGNIPNVWRPTFLESARTWLKTWQFSRWTIGEFVADSIQGYGMALIVAAAAGPAGASIFSVTRNLVGPIYTLVAAIGISDMPRMARAFHGGGLNAAVKSMKGSQLFVLIFGLPYLLLIFYFSSEILAGVYGLQYASFATELRLWSIIALLLMLLRPVDMWLLASFSSHKLFWSKCLGAATTLILASVLVPVRSVEGSLIAIVFGMITSLVIQTTMLVRWRRSNRL